MLQVTCLKYRYLFYEITLNLRRNLGHLELLPVRAFVRQEVLLLVQGDFLDLADAVVVAGLGVLTHAHALVRDQAHVHVLGRAVRAMSHAVCVVITNQGARCVVGMGMILGPQQWM